MADKWKCRPPVQSGSVAYRKSEDKVNRKFFDSHANIGLVDFAVPYNLKCPGTLLTRHILQCPINPHHRFCVRKDRHVDYCGRAAGVGVKTCTFNEYHWFREEDEEDHYRFCCTLLMIRQRFALNFPNWRRYDIYFDSWPVPWSVESYLEYRADKRDFSPNLKEILPDSSLHWNARETISGHEFIVTGRMLTDLTSNVIKLASKIDLKKREEQFPLPNFYNRRPPRLHVPEVRSEPDRKPKKPIVRERFDIDAWWKTEPDVLNESNITTKKIVRDLYVRTYKNPVPARNGDTSSHKETRSQTDRPRMSSSIQK